MQDAYVSEITITSQFSFILIRKHQLEVLHMIPSHDRIAFFDATGGLVKIPKSKSKSYNKILNYVLILKVSLNYKI